jgi:hypothetical protein
MWNKQGKQEYSLTSVSWLVATEKPLSIFCGPHSEYPLSSQTADFECAGKLSAIKRFVIQLLSRHSSSGASEWRRSTISNDKECSLLRWMLPSANRPQRSRGRPVTPKAHCADDLFLGEKIRQTQTWEGNNHIFQPQTEKIVLNIVVDDIGSKGMPIPIRDIREAFQGIYRQDHPRDTRRHHFAVSNG